MLDFKHIRNQWVALAGLILSLIPSIRHNILQYLASTTNGEEISVWANFWAFFTLASLEFAVIVFAIHGQKRASVFFAIMLGLINLFYFWSHVPVPDLDRWVWNWQHIQTLFPFLPGLLYSTMFAVALPYFSHTFTSYFEVDARLQKADEQVQNAKEEVARFKQKAEALGAQMRAMEKANSVGFEASTEYKEMAQKISDQESMIEAAILYLSEKEGLLQKDNNSLNGIIRYHSGKETPLSQLKTIAARRSKAQISAAA